MTVLSVAQDVSAVVGISRPAQVFASTDTTMIQLRTTINDMAVRIAEAHEWQKLKRLNTETGNGIAEAFVLPSDYGRMLTNASIWSSRYIDAMQHITSTDEWLQMQVVPYTNPYGMWTIYGGELHIQPIMDVGETARYFYISSDIVLDNASSGKEAFSADDDAFVLPERLLTFATIWQWKANHGLPYQEDIQTFEIALREEINKDGGSKPVLSSRGWSRRTGSVWPGTVSPPP